MPFQVCSLRWRIFCAAMLIGLAPSLAAYAEPSSCALKRWATIPASLDDSRILLDAGVNGTPVKMVLDTGGGVSVISEAVAKRLAIDVRQRHGGTYGIGGGEITTYAYLKQLRVGDAAATDTTLMVMPGGHDGADGKPVGYFGADYLDRFDVEIDLAGGKVTFFSQDHCKGKVVYWTDSYFKVPFSILDCNNPQIEVTVTLDGKPVRAVLDTGAATTTLRLSTASRLFGLSADASGVDAAGTATGLDGNAIPAYRHVFDALVLGPITLPHRTIVLAPITFAKRTHAVDSHMNTIDESMPDLYVGMDVLSRLHLFIAYSEEAVYFTLADEAKSRKD